VEHRTIVIVCGHVFKAEREVALVLHDSDGIWQLVCGANDHPEDCSDFEPVGLEHLLERQRNLADVLDLPSGSIAEFDADGWIRTVDSA
jgi:hypothetical protein